MKFRFRKPTLRERAYGYRVALAAGAVATFYGVMSAQEVAVWGGFAAVFLGTGVAVANTSTEKES